jgi:colanic acid biosynthesis glycosyl transferase WcaI
MFTQWWPPEPAHVVGALAKELARREHVVEVVTAFPNYPSGRLYPGYRLRFRDIQSDEALRIIRVPIYPSHDRSGSRRIANYLSYAFSSSIVGVPSLSRPEVAYVYHPPITSAWPAALQKLLLRVPFILHIQDLWPESVTNSGMVADRQTALVERVLARLCLSTYSAAAHLVVISTGFRDALVARGVSSSKISVVRNWADEELFFPKACEGNVRAEIGPAEKRVVLYAGNLGDYQGLDSAVRAAASIAAISSLHLTLIGDGTARRRLEALVNNLAAPNVWILPPRPAAEMNLLLSAADAHLVCLLDRPFLAATIPGKTQVALASAKFIIMGARGSASEIVKEANAGLTCMPSETGFRDAFLAFCRLSDVELRRTGLAGREYYMRRLSLVHGADSIEAVMFDIANGWRGKVGSEADV